MKRYTIFGWIGAFVISLIILVPFGALGVAQPILKIGHGMAAEEPLWLMGVRPDLTPNQGKKYKLELIRFRGTTNRFQAFLAGELDGGTAPAQNVMYARDKGMEIKLVASICQETDRAFSTAYLTMASSGIKSTADLKGKKVGIVDHKSATDLWAREAVRKAGLNPDRDVKWIVVPFPAMGNALRSGKIDVGTFPEPFFSIQNRKGGIVKVFDARSAMGYDHELMTLWLSEKAMGEKAEAVRAFIADYAKANAYYIANKAKAKTDIANAKRFVRAKPEQYVKLGDYYRDPKARHNLDTLQKLGNALRQHGWLEKPVVVKDMVDLSYLPQ
ncbi:MAG: ABC transporter substrate-binding protein [Candidatus Binatia bacterium]